MNIITAIIEFSQTPIGWATAALLGVLAVILMRVAHVSISDVLKIREGLEIIMKDPFLTSSESTEAAKGTKKKYEDIRSYLEKVSTPGATKTQKLFATAKILLK